MPSHDTPDPIRRARRQTLGDIPRRSALRYPDKTAIVDGDVRLSFTEFDATVDRVAAALTAAGLSKGDALGLLSHNCWQYPVLAFATARIGVILVPINFMLVPDEIAYILDHSGCVALVAEDTLVATADHAITRSAGMVRIRAGISIDGPDLPADWADVQTWCDDDGPPAPEIEIGDDDPLRLMYTSGTESRPKGALLSSRSLMWQYISCIVTGGMEASDVEVHALPLYHCAQLDNFLATDLYLGATSVILRGPDPTRILRAIEREQATNLFAPPTVWISLLRSPELDKVDVNTLAKGYYGASAMPREILAELRERFPKLRLWNFYGQTEMASLATALGPADQAERAGSAGRPALNVETRIVDERNTPLPAGHVGEIVHRSPHATVGYHDNAEKTAESFAGGWFHSGDLGYLDDDGFLWVVDRKKDIIKTGGENVASREVEEVLYQLDGVEEAAVFALPHTHWIEAVTAVVVAKPDARLDERTVIEHSRARLAGYKVPKYVVIADELPKNPSGKILKRVLRDTYASMVDESEER
ncbi:MAG: acyl-CoA synthetase [Pseudonocardia sp.]|nr:acyl-CoA synthetase [Pseudonocardia sp.]